MNKYNISLFLFTAVLFLNPSAAKAGTCPTLLNQDYSYVANCCDGLTTGKFVNNSYKYQCSSLSGQSQVQCSTYQCCMDKLTTPPCNIATSILTKYPTIGTTDFCAAKSILLQAMSTHNCPT